MIQSRIRPGRLSLVAIAAIGHAITHAATPVQLFGADEERCVICGQAGHCSADCRKGMVIKGQSVGMSQTPFVAIIHSSFAEDMQELERKERAQLRNLQLGAVMPEMQVSTIQGCW